MHLRLELTLPLGVGRTLTARADVSASLIVLSGPSGCGKSSLVRSLAGVEQRARGLVSFNAETWLDSARRVGVASHLRGVGWAPQEAHLFPQLSVAQNLGFSGRAHRSGPSVSEVSAMLELDGTLSRQPRHLSGGERQRVALGRALLSSPRLLLLDEPFSALDRPLRRRVIERLHAFIRDHSIPALIVSHDASELSDAADVMWEIEAGQLINTKASSLGGATEARHNPLHGGPSGDDSTNRH